MKGLHHIIIESPHLKYEFDIKRNITIIQGDSATGKTTLVDLISEIEHRGTNNQVRIQSDVACRVYAASESDWQVIFPNASNTIFFIDEGYSFIFSKEFAELIRGTDNYYVLITRRPVTCLPYSINEVYGIRTSGRFHFPEQVYHEFYHIYDDAMAVSDYSDVVIITEDSKSGFQFINACCGETVRCISASGNSEIYSSLVNNASASTIVMADGAAFGAYIEKVLLYAKTIKGVSLYLPESFEWLILKSGIFKGNNLADLLAHPEDFIDSRTYFSWERFFTDYLEQITSNDELKRYKKQELAAYYLEGKGKDTIINVFPAEIQKFLK